MTSLAGLGSSAQVWYEKQSIDSTKASAPVSMDERAAAPVAELARIRPARRRSLPEAIVAQLLELIASAGTPEYRLPPERALCEQLGVSRTSLREALSALRHLG